MLNPVLSLIGTILVNIPQCWALTVRRSMCGSSGGGGGGDRGPEPLKNHKNIGFLSNTGPDPLKIHKATKPAFDVWPSSARQRNDDCWFLCYLHHLSPHRKKKRCQSWTHSGKTFWIGT